MASEKSRIGIELLNAANGFECSDKEFARRIGADLVNAAAAEAREQPDMPADKHGLMMKYFVLKPKGDTPYAIAAREALRAYAKSIDDVNPVLAQELKMWATREAMADL